MNVRRAELSPSGQERQERLPLETGLNSEVLRDHGALGVDMLARLNDRIRQMLRDEPELLIWKGFAHKEQRIAIAELALMVAHARRDRTGIHTPKQIAWAWSQLGRIKTLPKFLRWFAGTFFSEDKPEGIDCAFQFLQACEFGFPRTIAAVEALVRQAAPDADLSYAAYIAAMECWFRPAWMKELDEAGIPLPLAERLASFLGDVSGRAEALNAIRDLDSADSDNLDSIDKFILDLALNRDD
jgi:hypothetical protein